MITSLHISSCQLSRGAPTGLRIIAYIMWISVTPRVALAWMPLLLCTPESRILALPLVYLLREGASLKAAGAVLLALPTSPCTQAATDP